MQNNSSLAMLIIALFTGVSVTSASAQEAKKPVKAEHKHPRKQIASCRLYSDMSYLSGQLNHTHNDESLVRQGLALGTRCSYNNRSRFTLGLEEKFYSGEFHFNHREESLDGSVSAVEVGFEVALNAALDLHRVRFSLRAGVQQTVSNHAHIDNLRIKQGDSWLDETDLANEFLSIDGDLQVLELGLDVEFPLPYGFFIGFGGELQGFNVNVNTTLDDEGRRILEALQYDIAKVERPFHNSATFFSLHPALTWCSKKWCTSVKGTWGVFEEKRGALGVTLEEVMRF